MTVCQSQLQKPQQLSWVPGFMGPWVDVDGDGFGFGYAYVDRP